MRWHAALLGLLVGTTTASCAFLLDFGELQKEQGAATGGTGGVGGEAGAGVPLDQLAAKYAQAICKRIDRCYGVLAGASLGDETCVDYFEKSMGQSVFKGLEKLTSLDRFQYHPELAPACLTAVENADCDVLFPIPVECDAAIEGKVALDGDCTHAAECQRGLYCDATPSACPGKCRSKPQAGEPCEDKGCLEGLQCEPISDTAAPGGFKLVCLPPVKAPLGGCEGGKFASCRIDMTCLGKESDLPGECFDIAKLFTAAETLKCNWQTGSLCAAGLHCALTQTPPLYDGVCVPSVGSGDGCKAALPDMCPAGDYCNLSLGVSGICEVLPQEPDPCAKVPLKALCKKGNRCVGRNEADAQNTPGTCRGIAGLTDSCSEDALCYSGYCLIDACATPNFCSQ